MGFFSSFVLIYLLGGLTFLPLVLSLFLLYSYLFLPSSPLQSEPAKDSDLTIRHPNDDQSCLKSGTDELAEKFYRIHDTDVAAGYFVVCREYVPGGVNGKPPERTTPAGEVIAAESPSVYQSMYRSLFDRRQAPTIEPAKNTAKNAKRARNVFYIVLRHGHLMLYDDANQVDVRYVISLAHHDVSIYGGEGDLPEGELWLKRNAIMLSRRLESLGDLGGPTPPFFFFSENLSDKEDFYFAMLQNQAKLGSPPDRPPKHREFDVKHIVTLVQRLHSSEELLQTRWINAVLGRLFLALYRTPETEEFVRTKIVKKISRVNKPNFISKIGLRRIDMGNGAPFIMNPRLKDLTVDGNCCIEMDVQYAGNFRMEISATVRIDLGQRFKAREVDIILAVVLKKLEGHLLLRFKPSPSNRMWISFETMPKIEMDIEPIVSSKQITYGIILRTIENKIREMVAESIVLPFWDDVPFLDTLTQRFRGGIWQRESPNPDQSVEIPTEPGNRCQVPHDTENGSRRSLKSKDDRTMSAPALSESIMNSTESRKTPGTSEYLDNKSSSASVSSVGKASSPPRAIRSRTFSHAADPVLTADHGKMDGILSDFNNEEKSIATSTMIEISSRSPPATPNKTPNSSPPNEEPSVLEALYHSREAFLPESIDSKGQTQGDMLEHSFSAPKNVAVASARGRSDSLADSDKSRLSAASHDPDRSIAPSTDVEKSNQNLLTLNTATLLAKKWGLNMFGRGDSNAGQESGMSRLANTLKEPIGRGHPLPPPGTPLPIPAKVHNKRNSISIPKRKPVAPLNSQGQDKSKGKERSAVFQPTFPRRKSIIDPDGGAVSRSDELLIIEAPYESAPNSPADLSSNSDFADKISARSYEPLSQDGIEGVTREKSAEEHNNKLGRPSTPNDLQDVGPSPRGLTADGKISLKHAK
ncbi:hypothetical protein BDW69DRAFT_26766 [Aspergillus filifer]